MISQRPKPVRILHIFGCMVRDGAEMRTLELMRASDRAQFQFDFCTLAGQPGDLDDEIRALGGHIHAMRLTPSFPWQFRRLLRQQRFDVVHSHVHHFSGFLLRIAAQAGISRRIVHLHTTDDGHPSTLRRRAQRRLMHFWLDRYATSILAVSRGTIESAWSAAWANDPRCAVIYNGIDVSPFQQFSCDGDVRREFGLPESAHVYLHIGRMDEQKNHKRLLAIFEEVIKRDPHAYLLLVGRGGTLIETWLRERVAAAGLQQRVLFVGRRTDVPYLLRGANLLLFPSLWEGLPGVVLEACLTNTPVLASDISGVREIGAHFSNVTIQTLAQSNEEWADTAVRLVDNRAPRMQQQGLERFKSSPFSLDDSLTAYQRVWRGSTTAW